MVECIKNLYEILGVEYGASYNEIKAAYKKLVLKYHPDINKTQTAEVNFKLLNNAYEVLSDPEKRRNYDNLLNISGIKTEKPSRYNIARTQYKKEKKERFSSNQSFNRFSSSKQTAEPSVNFEYDIIKEIKITVDEAINGTKRTVNILNKQICPKCHGKKFINSALCAFCKGEGEKKEYKKIEVDIKKNVKDDDYIYVGKINSSAVLNKNLFLKIKIKPYEKLFFENDNVLIHLYLSYEDLILGTKKEIAIQEAGLVNVVIPPLCAPETRIKLDIKDNKNINYYAVIRLFFPEYISNDTKILYDKIRRNSIGEEYNAGRC